MRQLIGVGNVKNQKRGRRKGQQPLGIKPEDHYGEKLIKAWHGADHAEAEPELVRRFFETESNFWKSAWRIEGRPPASQQTKDLAVLARKNLRRDLLQAVQQAIRKGEADFFRRMATAVERNTKQINLPRAWQRDQNTGNMIEITREPYAILRPEPTDKARFEFLVFIGDRARRSDKTFADVLAHFRRAKLWNMMPEHEATFRHQVNRWCRELGVELARQKPGPKPS